jgi:hypothetical protein
MPLTLIALHGSRAIGRCAWQPGAGPVTVNLAEAPWPSWDGEPTEAEAELGWQLLREAWDASLVGDPRLPDGPGGAWPRYGPQTLDGVPLARVVRLAAEHDPGVAWEWIAELPPGYRRDAAVASALEAQSWTRPAEALALRHLVSGMGMDALRVRTAAILGLRAVAHDRAAADDLYDQARAIHLPLAEHWPATEARLLRAALALRLGRPDAASLLAQAQRLAEPSVAEDRAFVLGHAAAPAADDPALVERLLGRAAEVRDAPGYARRVALLTLVERAPALAVKRLEAALVSGSAGDAGLVGNAPFELVAELALRRPELAAALSQRRAGPRRLVAELARAAAMSDPRQAAAVLHRFAAEGPAECSPLYDAAASLAAMADPALARAIAAALQAMNERVGRRWLPSPWVSPNAGWLTEQRGWSITDWQTSGSGGPDRQYEADYLLAFGIDRAVAFARQQDPDVRVYATLPVAEWLLSDGAHRRFAVVRWAGGPVGPRGDGLETVR